MIQNIFETNWTDPIPSFYRCEVEERGGATPSEFVSEAAIDFGPPGPFFRALPSVPRPAWMGPCSEPQWLCSDSALYCLTLWGAREGVKLILTLLTAPLIAPGAGWVGRKSPEMQRLFRWSDKTRVFASIFWRAVGTFFYLLLSHFISICNVLYPFLFHKVARKIKGIPLFKGAVPRPMKTPSDYPVALSQGPSTVIAHLAYGSSWGSEVLVCMAWGCRELGGGA